MGLALMGVSLAVFVYYSLWVVVTVRDRPLPRFVCQPRTHPLNSLGSHVAIIHAERIGCGARCGSIGVGRRGGGRQGVR